MFQFNTKKTSTPFLYRLSLEMFGREVEVEVSLESMNKKLVQNLSSLQDNLSKAWPDLLMKITKAT